MRASPRRLILGAAVVAALSMVPATAWGVVRPAIPSDFDGDGHVDLAIGAPGEAVGGTKPNAGVVHVLLGSAAGLTTVGDQLWSQDSPGVKGCQGG
jgi:hypothetical protein